MHADKQIETGRVGWSPDCNGSMGDADIGQIVRRRASSRSPNEHLLKDAHDAMTDLINDWDATDSPEAFHFSMKGVMVIRDRIAARLGLPDARDGKWGQS